MKMVQKEAAAPVNRMARSNMYAKSDNIYTSDASLLYTMNSVNEGLSAMTSAVGSIAEHNQKIEIETQKNIDVNTLNLCNSHSKNILTSYKPDMNTEKATQNIQALIETQKNYHNKLMENGISERATQQLALNLDSLEQELHIRQKFGRMELAEKQREKNILDNFNSAVDSGDVTTAVEWYDQAQEKGIMLKFPLDKYISAALKNKETVQLKGLPSVWDLRAFYEDLDDVNEKGESNFIEDKEAGIKLNADDVKELKTNINREISDRQMNAFNDLDEKERKGEEVSLLKYEQLYTAGLIDLKTLNAKKAAVTEKQIAENFGSTVDLRSKVLTHKFNTQDTEKKAEYVNLWNEIAALPMETSEEKELKRILKSKFDGTFSEKDNFQIAADTMVTAAVKEMKDYGLVKKEQSFLGFDYLWKDETQKGESAARMKLESEALRKECEGLKDIGQVPEKIEAWKKRIKEPIYLDDFQKTVNSGSLTTSDSPENTSEKIQKTPLFKNATEQQKYLIMYAGMKGLRPEEMKSILEGGRHG